MNVAVDKIMEARKYDGVASKLKADTAKKTAQKTAANGSDEDDHAAAHGSDLHCKILIYSRSAVSSPFSSFLGFEFRICHRRLLPGRSFFLAIRLIF